MEKLTLQVKFHSGDNLEVLPYFLYEVDIYRISFNRINLLSSRYYISDKFLEIKNNHIKI